MDTTTKHWWLPHYNLFNSSFKQQQWLYWSTRWRRQQQHQLKRVWRDRAWHLTRWRSPIQDSRHQSRRLCWHINPRTQSHRWWCSPNPPRHACLWLHQYKHWEDHYLVRVARVLRHCLTRHWGVIWRWSRQWLHHNKWGRPWAPSELITLNLSIRWGTTVHAHLLRAEGHVLLV